MDEMVPARLREIADSPEFDVTYVGTRFAEARPALRWAADRIHELERALDTALAEIRGCRSERDALLERVQSVAACECDALHRHPKDRPLCSTTDRCSPCRCAELVARLHPQACVMVVVPSFEGSPDYECGKPAVAVYHGNFVCTDCIAGFDDDMRLELRDVGCLKIPTPASK